MYYIYMIVHVYCSLLGEMFRLLRKTESTNIIENINSIQLPKSQSLLPSASSPMIPMLKAHIPLKEWFVSVSCSAAVLMVFQSPFRSSHAVGWSLGHIFLMRKMHMILHDLTISNRPLSRSCIFFDILKSLRARVFQLPKPPQTLKP